MDKVPPELAVRLLYILYRGWVEARARSECPEQIFDLADAMHNIPAYLAKPLDGYLECIREDLQRYKAKHPDTAWDYVPYLDGAETEKWFIE